MNREGDPTLFELVHQEALSASGYSPQPDSSAVEPYARGSVSRPAFRSNPAKVAAAGPSDVRVLLDAGPRSSWARQGGKLRAVRKAEGPPNIHHDV
eukprot:8476407-Pyramimonas_sp.AAC.1